MNYRVQSGQDLRLVAKMPSDVQHGIQKKSQGKRPLLWAALLFPDLALERHANTSNPQAIVVRDGAKRLLMSCNAPARLAGLHEGLTLNAAYAICPSLIVDDYNEELQQQHINALCHWAMHYSSWVAPVMPDTVMLEIGASLALFDGLDNFIKQLQADIQNQNITVVMGVAPTPAAARLLSRISKESDAETICITDKHCLESALQEVPVTALPFDEFTHKGLRQSGIKHCQQLFKLPASSLTRRFGSASTEIVYKLLGLSLIHI